MKSKKNKGLGKVYQLFGDQKKLENTGKIENNSLKALVGELAQTNINREQFLMRKN